MVMRLAETRRSVLHSLDDSRVAGAPADVAGQSLAQEWLLGVTMAGNDVTRSNQHARGAVTTLQTVTFVKAITQLGDGRIVAQAFECLDVGAVHRHGERDAGPRNLAVDDDGAAATDAVLTTEMDRPRIGLLAQEIRQCRTRIDRRPELFAVDGELNFLHQRLSSSMS